MIIHHRFTDSYRRRRKHDSTDWGFRNLWNRACDDITRICVICESVVDHLLTKSIFKR
jgi:hypothetical protein